MSEEETVFGDVLLTDCKEIKKILPQASGVRVRIDKASVKDNSYEGSVPYREFLNLQLRIVDGISFVDENGEAQTEFKNKCFFTDKNDLEVWADPLHEFNVSMEKYGKSGAYLVPIRKFLLEAGQGVKGLTVNSTRELVKKLCEEKAFDGMEFEVNVIHASKWKPNEAGKIVKTGEFKNQFKNWKKA